MTIKYAPLFRLQENALTQYLFEEYGMLVSTRITDKILADIQDIPPFTSKYPLYMNYRGYEIHRIAQKRNKYTHYNAYFSYDLSVCQRKSHILKMLAKWALLAT